MSLQTNNHRAPLLEIDGLTVEFPQQGGTRFRALDSASLRVAHGEVHALVGASGSGKTLLALSALRILPDAARILSGSIRWKGVNLIELPERDLREIRGRGIGMLFQNATGSLNPALTVRRQMDILLRHRMGLDKHAAETRIHSSLMEAGLDSETTARILQYYPGQLSGGMAQRVALATVLACEPQLMIADEPTTGLDSAATKSMLLMLAAVQKRHGVAMLFISHDLPAVRMLSHCVSVMHNGRTVESAPTATFFSHPSHEHSKQLLQSVIRMPEVACESVQE